MLLSTHLKDRDALLGTTIEIRDLLQDFPFAGRAEDILEALAPSVWYLGERPVPSKPEDRALMAAEELLGALNVYRVGIVVEAAKQRGLLEVVRLLMAAKLVGAERSSQWDIFATSCQVAPRAIRNVRRETTERELVDLLLDTQMSWDGASRPLRGVIADLLALDLKRGWASDNSPRWVLPLGLGACWWNNATGQVEVGLNIPALHKVIVEQLGMGRRYNQPKLIRDALGAHKGFMRHSYAVKIGGIAVRVTVLALDRADLT